MNSHTSKQKSEFVLPGERLGVIEEFVPDSGTYVKDGAIYSSLVGNARIDVSSRHVSVSPVIHAPLVPEVGSTVLGQVTNVQPENASLRIFKIENKQLSGVFTGVLHVSDVQLRYVESMFDVCRPADVLRASVISNRNRVYHLCTKDKSLGVVYAFCSQCGSALELKRQVMHCPKCGMIEKRKTAMDYGKVPL